MKKNLLTNNFLGFDIISVFNSFLRFNPRWDYKTINEYIGKKNEN